MEKGFRIEINSKLLPIPPENISYTFPDNTEIGTNAKDHFYTIMRRDGPTEISFEFILPPTPAQMPAFAYSDGQANWNDWFKDFLDLKWDKQTCELFICRDDSGKGELWEECIVTCHDMTQEADNADYCRFKMTFTEAVIPKNRELETTGENSLTAGNNPRGWDR